MILYLLQVVLLFSLLIAALRMGGEPERYVAIIYVCMLVASSAYELFGRDAGHTYQEVHKAHFILDGLALFAVVTVALRFDRWWTLWVGSAQLLAVVAHLLRAFSLPIPPLVYAVMERWPVWIAILFTATGLVLHVRRETRASTAI
jgi:hypothetical protein